MGDLWNFPAGLPHSIQALDEGCEFLLVFDDGTFSEDSTFLISDWFNHTPKDVLAKNFGVAESEFADLPTDIDHTRYMFPVPVPGPLSSYLVATGIVLIALLLVATQLNHKACQSELTRQRPEAAQTRAEALLRKEA